MCACVGWEARQEGDTHLNLCVTAFQVKWIIGIWKVMPLHMLKIQIKKGRKKRLSNSTPSWVITFQMKMPESKTQASPLVPTKFRNSEEPVHLLNCLRLKSSIYCQPRRLKTYHSFWGHLYAYINLCMQRERRWLIHIYVYVKFRPPFCFIQVCWVLLRSKEAPKHHFKHLFSHYALLLLQGLRSLRWH